MNKTFVAAFVAAVLLSSETGTAQVQQSADSNCTYESCALSIAPAWNGLAVVRGTSGSRIANLHFFFPHDISGSLAGNNRAIAGADSAAVQASRALQLRSVGAVLTDTGLLTLAIAGSRALISDSNKRVNGALAAVGVASLGLSVPFQFAADGALSRAVWWHNLRYARSESLR